MGAPVCESIRASVTIIVECSGWTCWWGRGGDRGDRRLDTVDSLAVWSVDYIMG